MTRRQVLIGTAATTASMAMPKGFAGVFQDSPTLKVGLIGCGGRGNGAIRNCFEADKGVVVTALGDIFQDHMDSTMAGLKKDAADRYKVGDNHFVGFDAYQKVLATDCDAVILTTPPGFRPLHFEAAVNAGKHVFMEKPVAVDGPGIRKVIEIGEKAKQKGLTVVAGTQRRADPQYMECMQRVHDGQIGDLLTLYAYWNQGSLWNVDRSPNMSDTEYQLRNWLYYTWLSGDHIVEQHVHNLDVCCWAMKGHPVKATSLGGRQVRTDPKFGHIFDHFATEYEFENGARLISQCRQIDGCADNVSEYLVGSKGSSNAYNSIKGDKPWRYEGEKPNPYVEEHRRLVKSIRNNEKHNEARQVAESVMTAIMGRMSAYSGKTVTWEEAFNSNLSLWPGDVKFGPMEFPPVAVPGKTAAL